MIMKYPLIHLHTPHRTPHPLRKLIELMSVTTDSDSLRIEKLPIEKYAHYVVGWYLNRGQWLVLIYTTATQTLKPTD